MDLTRKELAINNGEKLRIRPWPSNRTCGFLELISCIKVLRTGFLSKFEGSYLADPPFSFLGGQYVQRLEKEWSKVYGTKMALSVNSATSGIFCAIGALELGVGDEIIVPASTMSAVAITPLFWNCIPVFADLDIEHGTISPEDIRKKITKKTKAIIVVHLFGCPADMDEIQKIAKEFDLKIIEDCAQAYESKYKGRSVGNFGDIGIFSLNVNKAIQVGEGGVCVTDNVDYFNKMSLIRNHGENAIDHFTTLSTINSIGMNFRMTEIQAAMAISQLRKVKKLTNKRINLVNYFKEQISGIEGIKIYEGRKDSVTSYYQFPIWIDRSKVQGKIEDIIMALNAEGAYFVRFSKPLYQLSTFQNKNILKHNLPWSHPESRDIDYKKIKLKNVELIYDNLLINEYVRPPVKKRDIDDLVNILKKVFK